MFLFDYRIKINPSCPSEQCEHYLCMALNQYGYLLDYGCGVLHCDQPFLKSLLVNMEWYPDLVAYWLQ